jgi:hypothetical protein
MMTADDIAEAKTLTDNPHDPRYSEILARWRAWAQVDSHADASELTPQEAREAMKALLASTAYAEPAGAAWRRLLAALAPA